MKLIKDVFGTAWYIIVCVKMLINQLEITQLTRKCDLEKCYILYMSNGKEIIIKNMI